MADFLTRLAERTLGVVPVAQPIIASIFANGRTMPNSPPVAEGFPVQDEVAVLTAPQTPAVHPARPAQSAPSPQSTLPGDRISNHPDDRRGRFIAPSADVSARNPDPIPSGFTPKDVEPPNRISNPPSDRISNPPSDRISILPGDRRGRLIAPSADVSAHRPDSLPSRFTPIDAQGEQVGRPDKASLGDVVSPRSRGIATPTKQQQETSSRQQTDLPLANEQSGNPADRQRQLPPSLLQNRQVATSQHLPAPISEAASSTPTIRVTIGRIDVRAVTPPAPSALPPRPKQARPGPTLSLDDYARQRKGGER